MEAELRNKDAIISDYKGISQILQTKLDVKEGRVEEQGRGDVGLIAPVERIR